MKKIIFLLSSFTLITLFACKKKESVDNTPQNTTPSLIFKFKFDSTQVRLDNFGATSSIPANHGAQSPKFKKISAHYIEFAPNQFTALGGGEILYTGASSYAGSDTAVDFDQATVVGEGEVFKKIPLSSINPGTYEWVRASLTYQNYDIKMRANGYDFYGNLASFVGYNTYITSYNVGGETITVNNDKLQGYWGFKVPDGTLPVNIAAIEGQAPEGATTVPNPNFANSPIPQGSCVVTGEFQTPLTITGNETSDITVVLSLSTNNSFEWKDAAGDNIYEPGANDTVVDMGLRGLIPYVE